MTVPFVRKPAVLLEPEPSTTAPFDPARFTRAAARSYRKRQFRLRDAVVDLYTAVLSLGVVAAFAGSVLIYFREQLLLSAGAPERTLARDSWLLLPQEAVSYGAAVAVLAGVAAAARRLGPVSVSRAEGRWWLRLPSDRRPMVYRGILRRAVLVGAAGAAVHLAYSFVAVRGAWDAGMGGPAAGAAVAGLGTATMVLLAALVQTGRSGTSGRRNWATAGAVLAAAAVLVLPGPALSGSRWPLVVAGLTASGLWLLLYSRLEQISGAELVRGGAVSGHAGAAVYFMDVNELSRALSTPAKPAAAVRGRSLYARPGTGPARALLRADLVAFLRAPGKLLLPAAALLACAVVLLLESGVPVYAQLAVMGLAACAAASAAGGVARQTALLRGVDRLVPLPHPVVRSSRMLAPALALAVWMALLGTGLTLAGAAAPGIIGLGVLAGIGLGAAAVRGGYREAPDWSVPPVNTPFGPVPSAQLGDLGRGLDTAFLSLFPFLLAVFLGMSPALTAVQGAASAAAVLVTVLSRR